MDPTNGADTGSGAGRGGRNSSTNLLPQAEQNKNGGLMGPPPPKVHKESIKAPSQSSVSAPQRSSNTGIDSAAPTPKQSRESSPSRHANAQRFPPDIRSRRNSQELSPNRTPEGASSMSAGMPSAAAVQRALSVSGIPTLQPSGYSESSRNGRAQKSGGSSAEGTPRWPLSPRITSPPPVSTRTSLQQTRRPEPTQNGPSIAVQRPTPPSNPQQFPGKMDVPEPDSDTLLTNSSSTPTPGTRTPRTLSGAGTSLATVEERSPPTSSGDKETGSRSTESGWPAKIEEHPLEDASNKSMRESESESGENKSDDKRGRKSRISPSSTRPNTVPPRKSYSTLNPVRGKGLAEGAAKNMTVETETVSSIPQVALGGGAGDRGLASHAGSSLRLKPSNETIRPKKEKKKTVRKTPSINTGTVSSKADIFEAKVASAVDEADSSDSEETFVYESNPPDQQPRPRYHSRTPSATSVQSQLDLRSGKRSFQSLGDGGHSVVGKKSMKFANNTFSGINENEDVPTSAEPAGRGAATVRARGNDGVSLHRHHHHIGRFGRGGGGHTSLFDNESPFPPVQKPLRTTASGAFRQSPRPSSPRTTHRGQGFGSRKGLNSPVFDIDGEGADDERLPLMGTTRVKRSRHPRARPANSSLRQMEQYQRSQRGWMTRFAGCIVLSVMVILVISGAVGFLFATTKPLLNVEVREIQNVLASEEELMLDLLVQASNPNVIAVTVADMDVNVFAKSRHVNPSHDWDRDPWQGTLRDSRRRRRRTPPRLPGAPLSSHHRHSDNSPDFLQREAHDNDNEWLSIMDSVDDGTDPIPDEGDPQTMLLGRIFEFDSALVFDASPFKRHLSSSVGEVRLAHPGNKTEAGGTERWERVIEYPFELIVRGVLKYQLPLGSHMRTTPIRSSVIVQPEKSGVGSSWPDHLS
ncbi:hypothetical protein L228DRAFT_35288 [Xylona heveae TC161]|uniref:Vacuolar segregation subunit 7-domain-containing protein n=1 Tax=Xylona heveae (strain CBS 132557 / TC161) TaxID=1328760 RepID=A0A165A814_XYLHT|nr:hypothetical protein L228DRAFT_35288 [Xylona heveae TC161]KZF20083.1 hypothetical protein L228DRAFT_35288 [Xylona heveae TC161]